MIFPDFEKNPGDRWVSKMAPFFVSQSRLAIAHIQGEIEGLSRRAVNDARNWAYSAEIRA